MVRVLEECRRVLIVEDDRAVARSLRRLLTSRHMEVEAIGTIGHARNLVQPFDCGVYDIDLPDGSGVELAKELMGQGLVPRAVFYTGSSAESVLADAALHGTVVLKSASITELSTAIEEACSRRPAAAVGETPVRRQSGTNVLSTPRRHLRAK